MKNNKFTFDIQDFKKIHSVVKDLDNILFNEAKEVPLDSLTSKICVSRPYFAFNKIYQFNKILIAPINKEQPLSFESTPITSAETSRHLAILGSCALGAINDERRYYLAVKGRKRAGNDLINEEYISKHSQTYALAMPLLLDKKEASAVAVLVNNKGQIIFNFKVGYQVFPKQFSRVFRNYYNPTKEIAFNPYFENLSFNQIVINDNILKARLPNLTIDQCAGHFDDFPMLPAGILAYMSINTAEVFLNHITNNPNLKYYLFHADMNVIAPISVDKKVELVVTYLGYKNNRYNFSWVMNDLSTDKILNTMNISFCASHELFSIQKKNKIEKLEQELRQYKIMYAELAYQCYQQKNTQTKIM